MYSYTERVGYSKCDESLHASNLAIVNFLQDAAIFEAQNQSISVEDLYRENLAWLLGSWQILIYDRPFLNEAVEITTSPYEFKGFLGYRNFTIKSLTGKTYVKATSIWSLINTETLKPARVTEEIKSRYEIREKLDMEYKPRKITLVGDGEELDKIKICKYQIDSNHHMNNSAYVAVALEYLPENISVKEIRVEYKSPIYLGDEITPIVYRNKNQIQVELKNNNDISAIIEMSY